uniref:Peptidoglycan-recognition protein n=1 Tax=Strigamia maritima TaxID=126957 RepID=T1J1Y7_STRMM
MNDKKIQGQNSNFNTENQRTSLKYTTTRTSHNQKAKQDVEDLPYPFSATIKVVGKFDSTMIKVISTFLFIAIILSIASSSIGDLEDILCRDVMIIGRREWGSQSETTSAKNISDPYLNVNFVVIHHTRGDNCSTNTECKQRVREIQRFDMDVLEKKDIMMHFLIGGDNRVYEGRGWGVVEEDIPEHPFALSIGFIGDYDTMNVPNAMLYSAQKLIQCGVKKKMIFKQHRVYGHRDVRCTTCPGDKLFKAIKAWASYSQDNNIIVRC